MRLSRQRLQIAAILVLVVSAGANAHGNDETACAPASSQTASASTDFPAPVAAPSYTPLTGSERVNLYLKRAYWSPAPFARATVSAFQAHLRDRPPEWGQGTKGYGRRWADRYARVVIKETFEATGAAILGHEVRYIHSARAGFLPRVGHALAATLVTYDRHGQRTPHVARVGATFATELTGNLWMPRGERTRLDALRGGGIRLGFTGLFNLLREFTPELKRLVHWK